MIISNYSISSSKGRRVLLINPPVYDTRYWDRWSQPYGLLRIAHLLKNRGYKPELIDCLRPAQASRVPKHNRGTVQVGDIVMKTFHFGMPLADLYERLNSLGYRPAQVYVTSIMTYWWESTRDVIALVKNVFPKAEVLLGGIYCPGRKPHSSS